MPDTPQHTADHLKETGRLAALAISESGFAFDPRTGQSYTLNGTAREVLDHLRRGATLQESARELAEHYGVPEEIALASTETFVRQLGRYLS